MPRPGPARKITDTLVEDVIDRTPHSKPSTARQWSTRYIAAASGLTQNAIFRIWKAFGLQPHRQEIFKLSSDPLPIEKVRGIVGLYLAPPFKAMVLCVIEKTQTQEQDRTQPVLPMMPGMLEKRTHDYMRHGMTTLFSALGIATGPVMGQIHRCHRSQDFFDVFGIT